MPAGATDFSFLQNVQTGCGYPGYVPGVMHRGLLLSSGVGLKNQWIYKSTPVSPAWRGKGKILTSTEDIFLNANIYIYIFFFADVI